MLLVMAGLVPAIHVFGRASIIDVMPGTRHDESDAAMLV
jgi:hypothetical protein